MQILLRKIALDARGNQEIVDLELSTDKLKIGSAPDADVQVLGEGVKADHAIISKNTLILSKGATVSSNGKSVARKVELVKGVSFQIGEDIFSIIESPPGFDLCIEWQVSDGAGAFLINAYKTDLSDTLLSMRPAAWIGFFLVLLLAAGWPLMDYFNNQGLEEGQRHDRADLFWSSGPLHEAHQSSIGDRCEACHINAFEQVTDQACLNCHNEVADHVPSYHAKIDDFSNYACQNCHKEHNEPAQLTITSDQLCVDCHVDEDPSVTGFSMDVHPPFKLSLVTPTIDRTLGTFAVNWELKKVSPSENAKETSHLKFPHDLHLDTEKVKDLKTDDQLACASCHALKADREHFEPIAMEKHCRDCHDLGFDKQNPQKQLPHGEPILAWEVLQAHFIEKSFNSPANKMFERRRLPGKVHEERMCRNSLNCAKKLAEDELESQFTVSGCVTCHEVEALQGLTGIDQWQVLPVKLSTDWYPHGVFDHQSHLTQTGETGNALCITCHDAGNSGVSEDILVPGMDNCLQCHDEAHGKDSVILECASCHAYHQEYGLKVIEDYQARQGDAVE